MKLTLPLITSIFFVGCSDPENSAETPASEEAKSASTPAPSVSPVATANSPLFDIQACRFLTEAQIKQTLGDQIIDVSIGEPSITSKTSQKRFTLTLANGNPLNLVFRMEPSSAKGTEKIIKEYTDNARDLPRLIKMEMAADGETPIGTHISQRRLYIFRPGQGSVPMLTYDVRGEAGGQTPEEIETRRQMGLSLINKMLEE